MAKVTTLPSTQWTQDRPGPLDTGVISVASRLPDHTEYPVKPNSGFMVPDLVEQGTESEPLAQWQERMGIDPSKQIKLLRLAHIRYQHTDLDKITKFMVDFGTHVVKKTENEVYLRGFGDAPFVYYARKGPEKKFLGATFEVESFFELEKAGRMPGASDIQELKDAPGGGQMVTLFDPEGFPVNLVYGQEPAATGSLPERVIFNYESDKARVRTFSRFTVGAAAVHKLGHFGFCSENFDLAVKWYASTFNLAPTDFLQVPSADGKGKDNVAFFAHIDQGTTPTDHHSFFITRSKRTHLHHSSFEVHDYDTQHLGHQWLAKQGYESVWGVGRHILGSQIFDYWWDTSGNMVEHYADSDLVNSETPVGYGPAGDDSLAVWGPEVPKWFMD